MSLHSELGEAAMENSDSDLQAIEFSPRELIAIVYRAVLQREPEPQGLAVHEAALKSGQPFEAFLKSALYSEEFRNKISVSMRDGTFRHPPTPPIPDAEFYTPVFSPWNGYGEFRQYYDLARDKTAVRPDSCHVLYQLALQALHIDGDFWECGVFKGGTASMLAELLFKKGESGKRLCLFDTFEGMPDTDPRIDLHRRGDFSDTSLSLVKEAVGHDDLVSYHPGFIPDTFSGLEDAKIVLAHVDVDIYRSVRDCCEFIFPRLCPGGFMTFDDYGVPSCPGARKAVDEYFRTKDVCPLVLPTGQAVVFRS